MKKGIKIIISLILSLSISIIYSSVSFAKTCEEIRNDVFRLHILANSDSDEDQQLKYKVRDYIIKQTADKLNLTSKEQAIAWSQDNIDYIKQLALEEIHRNGYNYNVEVNIEEIYFATRQYGHLTLPAGQYMALRIEIGEAKGKNWWCVLFPQLCIPSSLKSDEAGDNFSDDQLEILQNGEKYKIGFWLVELFSKNKTEQD